jgi:hypothetical protein
MASIHKEIAIDVAPAQAWDALRDWGGLHTRLVPGFATDLRLEEDARIVTFASGAVLREVLVDLDEDRRRLAWTIVDGPYTHHNGVAQILDGDPGGTVFVWVADLLPDALARVTAESMQLGLETAKRTLESAAA